MKSPQNIAAVALVAVAALRHAADLAELAVKGRDPEMAVRYLRDGIAAARAALRSK